MGWIWVIPGLLILLIGVVLFRTLTWSRAEPPEVPLQGIEIDAPDAAAHLVTLVQCPTISIEPGAEPPAQVWRDVHHRLEQMYPRVHTLLSRQIIGEYSLLYTWPGTQPDLEPVLLMAHLDVVPADPTTLSQWEHPPFAGEIADGYIWGRGTQDVKNQVSALLDAVEGLLAAGYGPRRTVYLAFGHDEELGGNAGATQIAAWLHQQGVRLAAVLDEGGGLVQDVIPGVLGPVALIGNAEKGYLTVELSVSSSPGHSSVPPRQTAIGILSQAITRLEAHPMPAHVRAVQPLFQGIGQAAPWLYRLMFANLWLLGGVARRVLQAAPQTNATMRTTMAATVISGGVKDNVLPAEARALVNCRLFPGDHSDAVLAHIRRVIADERVQVRRIEGMGGEAIPESSTLSPMFASLKRVIRHVFGPLPVTPFLMLGATDSRHYRSVCDNIYRFTPVIEDTDGLDRVHGINERIKLEALNDMVRFCAWLIQAWAG